MYGKPDIVVLEKGAYKGLSIDQLRNFNIAGNLDGAVPDLGVSAAYTKVGWLKRCVNVRARALASMPFSLFKGGSEEPFYTQEMDLPPEFEWLDFEDAFFRADASLALAGLFAALKENEGRGVMNLLWWNPETVEPEQTAHGLTAFKRTVNGAQIRVPAEDVLHGFQPDPFVEQGAGSSDGFAARASAQVLSDLAAFSSDQLRNGLPMKPIFTVPGDARAPSEPEQKRIKHFLNRFLLGARATPPEVLTGGIQVEKIGSSLAELRDHELTAAAREDIATSLGIPHSLVMSNAANFATAQADQLNFYITTVIPQSTLIANAFNRQLFEPMGIRMRFEPNKLEVMQAVELEKAESVTHLAGVPVLTVNEARELLGKKELTPEEIEEHLSTVRPPARVSIRPGSGAAPMETTEGKSKDLIRWQRAIKRRGRGVDFKPDRLSEHEALVIKERIASGLEIKEVFKGPFVGF